MDKHRHYFPVRYLVREQDAAQRIKYHAVFWLVFVAMHLLYFVADRKHFHFTRTWVVSYSIFYLRFVPVFYLSIAFFNLFRKKFYGAHLVLITAFGMLLLMHLANVSVFYLLKHLYGVPALPPIFSYFNNLYLRPLADRHLFDWISMLIYDTTEMQLLFLPLGLKMSKYGIRQEIERRDLETEKLRSDISTLRLQPAPHLVLNILNTVLAEVQPVSDKAAEYVENLTSVMRFSLYQTKQDTILLYKEWTALLDFIQLEYSRFDDRMQINIHQDGTVPDDKLVPTLMLFTLAENAFKHGVYPCPEDCWIRIDLKINSNELNFTIANSKPAAAYRTDQPKNSGIGLDNIKRRLAIYYPANYSIDISENENSYTVRLRIPLISKEV